MEQTGYYGWCNNVKSFRRWSIDDGTPNLPEVHSGTAYGTKRSKGIHTWQGSFEAAGHIPAAWPGDTFAFQGYKNPDSSGSTANGDIWSGNVIVTQVVININFSTNEIINHTVTFEGDGALSKTSGALITDTNAPEEQIPENGKIVLLNDLDTLTTETRLAHVVSATLTLSWPAVSAVNSGTSTGTGAAQTQRSKGPAFDWTLALVSEEANIGTDYDEGVQRGLRVYTTATQYYECLYGTFGERSGLVVDRQSGDFQQITHTMSMDSHRNSNGDQGSVTSPGGTTGDIWGA